MEWKPNWWARLFRGARTWTLSIIDGRLRIQGIAVPIDVDVFDVTSLAVRERPRVLLVSLTHDREAVLAGVSRRSAQEIQAAHVAEVAERHRLQRLFAVAAEQGESARL